MELLERLKDYLADRPEAAFLALTLVALFYMFRKYDQSQLARIEMTQVLAPLTAKLCRAVEHIGRLNGRKSDEEGS